MELGLQLIPGMVSDLDGWNWRNYSAVPADVKTEALAMKMQLPREIIIHLQDQLINKTVRYG